MRWISTTALLAAICLELAAERAVAQEGPVPQGGPVAQSFDALSAHLEQQDEQIRQLQWQLSGHAAARYAGHSGGLRARRGHGRRRHAAAGRPNRR